MLTSFKYDVRFQERILAIVLRHEDALRNLMHIIEPKYFTTPMLQLSWSLVVRKYVNDDAHLSLDSLCMLLDKSGKFKSDAVAEFRDHVETADLRDSDLVIKEVVDFCKQAAYFITLGNSVPDIEKGNFDKVVTKVMELAEKDFGHADDGLDYFKDIGKRYIGEDAVSRSGAMTTGLPLDQYWGGGLGYKELGFVFAPTGRGKSAMLLNIAYHALRAGENVLYISCELSEVELAKRMDKIMMSNLRAAEAFMPTELIAALKEMQKESEKRLRIKEFSSGELTIAELYSYVRGQEAKHRCKYGLLIVDYLGEMKLPKAEREDIKYKDMATSLRGLARKLETRIWSAHQTKQGSHRKTLLLEDDISDSSGILKVCDMAFTLSSTHIEFLAGYTRATIIKNRFGPTNMTEVLKFNGLTQRFLTTDISEMNEAVQRKAQELEISIFGGEAVLDQ